jgi:DNA-binding transcriptional MerR regulator
LDANRTDHEYTTKDIASKVDIAESTVRKYSQVLEKAGYPFTKNENGRRIFHNDDIFVFNEMKNISKKNGMPVEKIAQMIVFDLKQPTRHEAESDTPIKVHLEQEKTSDIVQHDDRFNQLMKKLEKVDMIDDIVNDLAEMKQLNVQLLEQLKRQDEYIKNNLEQRDRKLMESLRTIQEQRQETKETAVAKQQQVGFWSRLFKK